MNELFTVSQPGQTLDAYVYDADTLIFNTSTHAFEVEDAGNWSDYAIPLVEVVGAYSADFPTQITEAGTYPYVVRTRAGSDPADTDALYATGKVQWSGSGEASETPSSSECDTFVTLAEVKTYNEITGTDQDDQITQMLPGVCNAIRKYLKRGVCATTRREVRSGRGTNYIRLYHSPVNTVTNVTFDLDGQNETTVSGNAFKWNVDTGVLTFKPQANPQYTFAGGFDNIQVIYNGGWVTVPADIKTAACMVVKQLLLLADPEALVTEKAVGQVKVKYADIFAGALDDPVLAQAVVLLKPYRRAIY